MLLDQQKIGEHSFIVRQEQRNDPMPTTDTTFPNPKGAGKTVEIDADFNVKFLFFNAYTYQHTNTEFWQGDCLVGLSSQTNDNGKNLEVEASTEDQQFVVKTKQDTNTFAACPMSFAYWNPALLEEDALVNAQTGKLEPVKVTELDSEQITVAGETLQANRYALELDEQTIQLWYAADDYRWLALETPAKGDRTLRYEATRLPAQGTPNRQQTAQPSTDAPSRLTNAMAH